MKKIRMGMAGLTAVIMTSNLLMPTYAASTNEIMDALTAAQEQTVYDVLDEQPIKPAEITDGGMAYIAKRHMQEFNGLLVRGSGIAALDGVDVQIEDYTAPICIINYTTEKPYVLGAYNLAKLSDYFAAYSQRERVSAAYREDDAPDLQELTAEDVYLLDMDYFPGNEIAEQAIVDYLTNADSVEIIGILQTDWYVKGYYDDWDVTLTVTPEEGFSVDADALNTAEYHFLRYANGGAAVKEDGLTFEEISALCDKLEARDDVSYAWIAPRYLEDLYANARNYRFTIQTFADTSKGDVNCDGTVTVADATMLARIAAEDTAVSVTAEGLANADMDGDGYLTAADTTAVLRFIADL